MAEADPVRTRIAPSPTGDPHVGNFYIALFDYVWARKCGGQFIVRIEDTDRTRFVQGAEERFLAALEWLGLPPDEGPDRGGPCGPYRQSERLEIYRRHADQLLEKGRAYPCFCSPERLAEVREAQKAARQSLGYDGHCRALPADEVRAKLEAGMPHVVRLAVPDDGETTFHDILRGPVTIENAQIDDQVLIKSDGFPTYHLANVVDDHLMRVTHVCRAEEWISSTPKHVLLYEAFGWDLPQFIHMPLLRNPDRSKISKRKNPTSIDWYREQGYLPEALRNFLALMGFSIGGDREIFSLQEMIECFSWDRVKTSGPVFDLEKLAHINGLYIRNLSAEELAARLRDGFTRHTDVPDEKLVAIVRLVQERITRLGEFDDWTGFFFQREPYEAADLIPKKRDADFVREVLDAVTETLTDLPWTPEALEQSMVELAEARQWKRRDLYMVLRVAVTCRRVSTPLFETMEILGREECMARLALAGERLSA
jgi:glutamyl-tRNA synthetase